MSTKDPHSFAEFKQALITHVDLLLRVDFTARTIHGEVHYQLDRPVSDSFFLDTRSITVHRVYADGSTLPWEFDQEDRIRGQRLHIKNLDSSSVFSIDFSTHPEASALQWLQPDQTNDGTHPFLFSQCQAIHARSVFPCQDSPSVRFTYSAEIAVPEPLTAVMAAAPVSVMAEDGVNRCRFNMPQSIPSYLFALAVGSIGSKDISERCRIYAEHGVLDKAAWEFEETEAKIVEAEKLFGPYIWDRYDILIMPPSFPYGGMENPRLTFLTPTVIIGDRSLATIVTHELAHSWTGNLITNATWEDFWLNEGWTTYAQMRIDEVVEGREYAQMKKALGREAMIAAMQRFGMESHLTQLVYRMQGIDPDDVFSSIPYYKGQAFLEAIEQAVGREKFDPFVSKYIETYKFKSLTTQAFVRFLEKELPQAVEAVDVESWLNEPGFPVNAPVVESKLIEDVDRILQAYQGGKRPEKEDVQEWGTDQVTLFMRRLPELIPMQDAKYFDEIFNLKESSVYAILSPFFARAVRSSYEDVLPRIEDCIRTVGRGFYLRPIVSAMAEAQWSRPLLRPMVERHRHRHHPLTVRLFEEILEKAGL